MYRLIPDEDVFAQVAALPVDALLPYAEALTVLGVVPANGRPYNADHILLVQWAG